MEYTNFKCDICKKYYKSYQSLWKHKKIYHPQSKPESKPIIDTSKPESKPKVDESKSEIEINKIYKCKFCLNEYKFKQSKWKHEKKCNKKTNLEDLIKQNEEKDKQIEEIIQDNKEMKKSLDELKKIMLDMMNKNYKMHPKTFQKMVNSNNNNNITINNNFRYVEYGKEDLHNVFTKQEKIMILKKNGSPIENIVRYTHLNDKYPQFQNIIITNVRSNQAYAYNEQLNKFILCDKNELLEEMMIYRYDDLIEFYNQYNHLLSPKLKETLNKSFLLKDDSNFCKNKSKEFNVIIYNECNKDNIKYKLNDLSLNDETLDDNNILDA
jgi:hypothetical protein